MNDSEILIAQYHEEGKLLRDKKMCLKYRWCKKFGKRAIRIDICKYDSIELGISVGMWYWSYFISVTVGSIGIMLEIERRHDEEEGDE